jgi:anti-sigma factor RsiW
MTQLSDEFLLAYLDGQLEKGQTAEVSQIAGSNPEVSRRVACLRRTQTQLMEALGGFAREDIAVPGNVLQSGTAGVKAKAGASGTSGGKGLSSAKQFLFVSAVFAGGVFGGYGAAFLTPQNPPSPPKTADRPPAAVFNAASWPEDIAKFHSFFPKQMLTPHQDAILNPEFIRYQFAKITAKAIAPPDFSHYGFTLYRGQTLRYRQDNMMQLTYSSKTDPPLTLYVLPAGEYADSAITGQAFGSCKAVSWVSGGMRFLLTAEKDEENLKVLAVIAQSQMQRKP